MASEDVQTNLRLPADLKERLMASAAGNNRSLSAEVAFRLQESYEADPKALASALKGQTAIAQTMAQFVISAIDIAGPQTKLTEEVFRLMRETASQIKAGEEPKTGSPVGELFTALKALTELPEGRDPTEFVETALTEFRNSKSQS